MVEMLPAIKAVMSKHPAAEITILDTIPNNFFFTEYLFKNHPRIKSVVHGTYLGEVDVIYNMPYTTPLKSNTPQGNIIIPVNLDRYKQSEVSLNLSSVMGQGSYPNEFYDVSEFFPASTKKLPYYDVVIHNGRSKHNPEVWDVKLIHNFHHIAEYLMLKGMSVGVIGSKDEYRDIGCDETGRPIDETVGLIRNCGYFVSSDTGTYHIAAALRKPGMVLFTATSPVKNHDPIFHSTIEVAHSNLPCFPCQSKGNKHWMMKCEIGHKCRRLLSVELLKKIYEKANEP